MIINGFPVRTDCQRLVRGGTLQGSMKGVGVDIVEVSRIAASLARTPDFAWLVFSEGERAFCQGRPFPERHFAARFAAKEGFLKAVGRGILDGIPLREIEVVQPERGQPALRLGPAAAGALASAGAREARVSLSRGARLATALVVLS